MAKPIKERGIRWTENYGDKSSYLKTEMEKQIGPGSYFRWEGHDSTTGTDYYVVVSPGYSAKKGYHFFAGLRKMPADHGASGKKFKNMRSALFYAYDMWRVPKPESMPAGWVGYNVDDISGKEIVLEGVHASSEKPVKVAGLVIYSPNARTETERESMAVQTMVGGLSNNRTGQQVLARDLCYAYRAAPVMGFLPAYYSQLRLIGLDGMNFNRQQVASTENRLAPDTAIPICPLVATCQPPQEDEFNRHFGQGYLAAERLYAMPDQFERKESLYAEFKKPLVAEDPDDVQYSTWGNVKTDVFVDVPAGSHDAALIEAWRDALSIRPRHPEKAAKRTPSSMEKHEYVLTVDAGNVEDYEEFVKRLTAQIQKTRHGKAKPGIQFENDHGKNFVRLYLRAKNIRKNDPAIAEKLGISEGFDLNQPCVQHIRQRGSQMLDYDSNGMPMKLVVQSPQKRSWLQPDVSEGEEEEGTGRVYYVLNDPVALVDRNVSGFAKAWESRNERLVDDMLAKFHELASRNKVAITADDVKDHRTTPPQIANPTIEMPRLNNLKLPVDENGKILSPEKIASIEKVPTHKVPMMSGSAVQAHPVGQGRFAARWFDVSAAGKGGYVYDDVSKLAAMPSPVEFRHDGYGRQRVDGAPVMVKNSAMYRPGKIGFRTEGRGKTGKRVTVTFDGRPSASDVSQLRLAGFALKRLKNPPFARWAGEFDKLPPKFVAEQGETDGFYMIRRGETTLYDPKGQGKVIPGNANDVILGPPMDELVSPGAPSGVTISYVKHKATYNPEAEFDPTEEKYSVRQQSLQPFMESVPSEEEVNSEEGEVFDPSYVAKAEGRSRVVWKDSLAALRFLKQKLQIPDNLAYPFARTTGMDRKVIDDRETAGIRCFEKYKGKENEVPEEMRDLYRYGKVVSECSLEGEAVPKEVWQALADALKNPEESLKPREIAKEDGKDGLMALLVVPKDVPLEQADRQKENYYWGSSIHVVEALRGDQVVLAPDYKGGKAEYDDEEISLLFPGSDRVRSEYQTLLVDYVHASGRRFSQPSMATRPDEPKVVYGQEELLRQLDVRPAKTTKEEEKEIDSEVSKAPLAEDSDTGTPLRQDEIGVQGETPSPPSAPPEVVPTYRQPAIPPEPTPEPAPAAKEPAPYLAPKGPADIAREDEEGVFLTPDDVLLEKPKRMTIDLSRHGFKDWRERALEKLSAMSQRLRSEGNFKGASQVDRAIGRLAKDKDYLPDPRKA